MNKTIKISLISLLISLNSFSQTILNDSQEGLTHREVSSLNKEIKKMGDNYLPFMIQITDNFWPYDDINAYGKNTLDSTGIQRILIISPQLKKVEVFDKDNAPKLDWLKFKNEKLIPYLKKEQLLKAIKEFLRTIK